MLPVTWNPRQLPRLWQWRMLGPGMYLTGLEPANGTVVGRAATRAEGPLDVLDPGATRAFDLRIEVPTGAAATPPRVRDGVADDRRDTIAGVEVMTIEAQLPAPVIFGDWIMHIREFALVRVRTGGGPAGYAYTLTRDGAVAEQIRKTIARVYVGTSVDDRGADLHDRLAPEPRVARGRASGCAPCRSSTSPAGTSPPGSPTAPSRTCSAAATSRCRRPRSSATRRARWDPRRPAPRPPSCTPQGWRRFKAPTGGAAERSAARLRAARAAAPDAWLGMDAAWVYDDVDDAADFVNSIPDVGLGWFEDVFPPGDAGKLRALRERTDVPIAQGDEQGGIYYPEALILADAVDVVRVDLTCMGGITARSADHRPGARRRPRLRAPHVPARPLAGPGGVGLHRRPDRVGHPVHRRPPDGRPAAAADHRRRWPDGSRSRRRRASGTSSTPTGSAASPIDDPDGILDGL